MAEDEDAKNYVKHVLGLSQAPAVYFRGEKWSGFHPDDTKAAATEVLASAAAV